MSIDIGKILEAIGGMVASGNSEPDYQDRHRRTLEEIGRISRHDDDAEGRLRAIHQIVNAVLHGHRHRDR